MNELTKITCHDGIYIKHDMDFNEGALWGTRGRMAYAIVQRLKQACYCGVVYACGRADLDMALVAQACQDAGDMTCDVEAKYMETRLCNFNLILLCNKIYLDLKGLR